MIEEFKNRYLGKSIFVIGNGPSLNVLQIEKLSGYYTVAMNYFIPHGIDKYSFTPTFWASSYGGAYKNHFDNLMTYKSKLDSDKLHLVIPEDYFSIIREGWKPIISPVSDPPTTDPCRIKEIEEKFNKTGIKIIPVPINLLPPRFFGCGVITHLVLPFCCYLGFKRIFFVGMDLGGFKHFYSNKTNRKLRKMRFEEVRTCWDGRNKSNYVAVCNLNRSIFSRSISEYNRLVPEDVKFYHTTPRPKSMTIRDRLRVKMGLSERKMGFVDPTGDGFYIHKLEDFVTYIDFNEALRMAEEA